MRTSICAVIALGLLSGCGGGSAGSGGHEHEIKPEFAGPIMSSDVTTGQTVYENNCGGCHPGGDRGNGPKLTGMNEPAGEVRQQVREGGSRMPPFPASRIGDDELEALLAYLVTIEAVEGETAPAEPTDMPADVPGGEDTAGGETPAEGAGAEGGSAEGAAPADEPMPEGG